MYKIFCSIGHWLFCSWLSFSLSRYNLFLFSPLQWQRDSNERPLYRYFWIYFQYLMPPFMMCLWTRSYFSLLFKWFNFDIYWQIACFTPINKIFSLCDKIHLNWRDEVMKNFTDYTMVLCSNLRTFNYSTLRKTDYHKPLGGSPGLVVMGDDSFKRLWVRIPAPYTGWTWKS